MAEKDHYEEAMNSVFINLLVRGFALCQEQYDCHCYFSRHTLMVLRFKILYKLHYLYH